MFGLFSSIQSPKSLLASKLSASLATYFDVDPSAIESNLVTDTKITLHQARLKPHSVGGSLLVGGVESIEFTWKWGGSADGSTSFVRDAVLSIRGARFRLIAQGAATTSTSTSLNQTTVPNHPTPASPGMLDKYLYQIFDHLTLNITDVEVVVETLGENQGRLVIDVQSLQLLSLGRFTTTASTTAAEDVPPLSQRFTLGSLRIYLSGMDGTEELPVLDPFSYGTSVRRVSGRRFQGLTHGLEITGDVSTLHDDDANRMVIHAGRAQLAALSTILGDVLDGSANGSVLDTASAIEEATVPSETTLSKDASTTVRLPFPSVTLILPNESKIQMPHCELFYVMDGTIFRLTGMEGIQVNDHPSPFLDVAKHCGWCVDLTTSVFSIRPTPMASLNRHDDDRAALSVVSVNWDEDQVKHLIRGFLDLEQGSRNIVEKGMKVYTEDLVETQASAWSIAIEGTVDLSVHGSQKDWIKASLCHLYMSASTGPSGPSISDLKVASMQFGPTSFSNISVRLPRVALDAKNDSLMFDGPVLASVESWSCVEQTQNFLCRVLDVGLSTTGDDVDSKLSLPCGIVLPSLQLDVVNSTKTSVQFREIRVDRSLQVTVDSIALEGSNDGAKGCLSKVSVSMFPDLEMRIGAVETFRLPGVVELDQAINDGLVVTMVNGVVNVEVNTVEATLLAPQGHSGNPSDSIAQKEAESIQLAFPISVQGKSVTVALPNEKQRSTKLVLTSLDILLHTNSDTVSAQSRKPLGFRLESSNSSWLEAQLEPMTAVLSSNLDVSAFDGGGLRIGPCSIGHFVTLMPAFRYDASLSTVVFLGGMELSAESLETLQAIQTLVSDVSTECGHLYPRASAERATGQGTLLPFGVKIPHFSLSIASEKMISVQVDTINASRCCSVSAEMIQVHQTDDGLDGTLFDITMAVQPVPFLQIGKIGSLRIPGIFEISNAVQGFSAGFVDGALNVEMDSVDVVMLVPLIESGQGPKHSQVVLPYPMIAIRVNSISATLPGKGSQPSLRGNTLDMLLSQSENGTMTLQTRCQLGCRLLGCDESSLEAQVEPFTAVVTQDFLVTKLESLGIQIGPCTFGRLSVIVPPSRFVLARDEIFFEEAIDVTVDSIGTLSSGQEFLCSLVDDCKCMQWSSRQDPLPTEQDAVAQNIKFFSSALRVKVLEEDLSFDMSGLRVDSTGSQVSCDHLSVADTNGTTLTVSGVVTSTTPDMSASIQVVDAFYIPGFVELTTPTRGVSLAFTPHQGLRVAVESLGISLLEAKSSKQSNSSPSLGFPIECNINELSCKMSNDVTSVRGIQLNAKPFELGLEEAQVVGVHFGLSFQRFQNKLTTIDAANVSGVYAAPNTISNLETTISSASVSAGFSSMEWHKVLKPSRREQESQSWNLPNARVAPFSAKVEYKGRVVSTATDLQISEFKGNPDCTSDELMKYMTNATLRQIPAFFGNVSVLGSSGRDMGASTVGQIALGAGLTGSIGGLVAIDSIRGAVKSGKVARGASSNDSYQFGDVTRGAIRAIGETAKAGSAMRGGDGSIQPGDFAAGASAALGQYTGENKQRLGSAGGSTLGMALGAVALGPIGLVAGCVVGGMAGARAFRKNQQEGEPSGDDGGSTTQSQRAVGDETDRGLSSRVPSNSNGGLDLLDQATYSSNDVASAFGGQSSTHQHASVFSSTNASDPFIPIAQPYDPFRPIENNGHPFATAHILPPETTQQQFGSSEPIPPFVPAAPFPDVWETTSFASRQLGDPHNVATSTSQSPQVATNTSNIAAVDFGDWQALPGRGRQHLGGGVDGNSLVPYDQASLPSTDTRSASVSGSSTIVTSGQYEQQTSGQYEQQTQAQSQYRFGDLTRSVIAKGKQSSGRSAKDGYQFGDFTRGFFSK